MAARIHMATRADALVGPLARLLAEPPSDPLAPELVGIPTRGMERWLSQQLAQALGTAPGEHDGICANVQFRFIGAIIGQAIAAPGADPENDPWRPERAVWRLIDTVEALREATWLDHLTVHIGRDGSADPDGVRLGRRYGALRHLADLFDRYAIHRPDMIRAWAQGHVEDGEGNPLPEDVRWQASLWRALRERIDRPSLPERLDAECARVAAVPEGVALPDRVAIVGVSRIPGSHLRVLDALARAREITLWMLHPSPELWRTLDGATPPGHRRCRADDPAGRLRRHPLLESWGRDACEMQLVVGGAAEPEWHVPDGAGAETLLGRLQADIRANRPPGDPVSAARRPLAAGDHSIQVHACHGRARQVEVLRDAVLHLLRADPTLEPRDVLVLCPDITTYAPLIEASFGGFGQPADAAVRGDGPVAVPIELADRSLRAANPMIAATAQLMRLARARVTATQVRELAACDVVRRRFRFTDEDLQRLEQLVADAGIRWGIDADARSPFGVEGLAANTWRSGIDRMLVGVAVGDADDRLVAGVTPLAGLDAGALDLVGRLAEFVDRIDAALTRLQAAQPVVAWVDAIIAAADLLTDVPPEDAWQRVQLVGLLDDLARAAGSADVALTAHEMLAILETGVRVQAGSARFRTGRITVASMIPMRGVPHRVVCLLGLDDDVFPRPPGRDGDDITLRAPRIGDRDPRGDDLQQLLDALMAATEHLVITYTGHDERTNRVQPPAVPVAELLEVIGQMVSDDLAGRVAVDHPLQPFDPRNFRPDAVMTGLVWGFDDRAAAGARTLVGPARRQPAFLAHPLPAIGGATIDLAALLSFVEHPIRAFLSARLGLRLRGLGDEPSDAIPLDLGGLDRWAVGDRMLRAARRGRDLDEWAAGEAARGTLPPGALGSSVLEEIGPHVAELAAEADVWQGDRGAGAVNVDLALGDGRRLVGTVPQVHDELLLGCGYSRLGHKSRLVAWVRLLALTAADPDRGYRSVVIGRTPRSGPPAIAVAAIEPLDEQAARRALSRLVDIYDRGMRAPAMIFPRTSAAYANGLLAGPRPRGGTGHLQRAWERRFGSPVPGENEDPSHQLVLGARLDFGQLWARHGDAVRTSALALWEDLIASEARSE